MMITVILIEDDPMVQEINKQFVEQIKGFKVIGIASNGAEGIHMIHENKPDLALVDIYMPNQDGLTTIKQIRSNGVETDVIVITAASEIGTIRTILQLGAFDYIMKPFKFERLKQALMNYWQYRSQLHNKQNMSQQQLDQLLFQPPKTNQSELPKGLNAHTLEKIQGYVNEQRQPISAVQVAEGIGIARVTARRYLEYMEQNGIIKLSIEYGGIGRPINRYVKE